MLGHGAKFDRKKEEAIAALLSRRSVEEAALAVGINVNALLRWMKEPEFDAAYRNARHTAFSHAIGRLQEFAGAAVTTVFKIMLEPNTPAGIRLRAAEVVLEQGIKAMAIEDIEARVAKLERMADSTKKAPKRSADLTLLSAPSLDPVPAQPQIAAPPVDSGETGE